MNENFEHIIKKALENYSKPAPDNVLNNLRAHYPKQGFTDFVSLNAAKIAVISAVIIAGIITTIVLLNNSSENHPKANSVIAVAEREVSLISSPAQNIPIVDLQNTTIPSGAKIENNSVLGLRVVNGEIFKTNDTTVCAEYFDLAINVDTDKITYSQGINLSSFSMGTMRISAQRPGVYYLKYREEIGGTLKLDSMRMCFASVSIPKIIVVDEVSCPGDALILKVETENPKNLRWDAEGAKIEKLNNAEYRFVWTHYEGQHITITASTGNRHCECSNSYELRLPEKITVSTSTKSATCNHGNGEVNIKCNKDDAVYFLDGGQSNNSGEFRDILAGKHNVLINYDATCSEQFTVTINGNQKLNADFQYSLNKENPMLVSFDNRTTLDSRTYSRFSDMNFTWIVEGETYFGDNQTILFDSGGDKQIQLIASYGSTCSDTVQYTVRVYNDILLIPNIFSPNGDGISDVFTVKTKNTTSFKGIITNTRGEVLYQWTNPSGGWDGYINGVNQAAEGVYFYIISVEFSSGNKTEKRGALNLVRY